MELFESKTASLLVLTAAVMVAAFIIIVTFYMGRALGIEKVTGQAER